MNNNPFVAKHLAYPFVLIADDGQVISANLDEYHQLAEIFAHPIPTDITSIQNATPLVSNWQAWFCNAFNQALMPLWQALQAEPQGTRMDGQYVGASDTYHFRLHRLAAEAREPNTPIATASLLIFSVGASYLVRSVAKSQRLSTTDMFIKQQQLEQGIVTVQQDLTRSINTLEALQEELRTTSEELMASNEELVASNEELSIMNEELVRLNNLHIQKFAELVAVHQHYDQALAAYDIPILFLDKSFHICRFTTKTKALFALEDIDVGRPLMDIRHNFDVPSFVDVIRTAITQQRNSIELSALEQRSWLATVTKNTVQPGWIISFLDTTHLEEKRSLQQLLDALPQHIAILSANGRILYTNRAWRRFALANGVKDQQYTGVGEDYLQACNVPDDYPEPSARRCHWQLRDLLDNKLRSFSLVYPCHSPKEQRWFNLQVIRLSGMTKIKAIVSHHNLTALLTKPTETADNE